MHSNPKKPPPLPKFQTNKNNTQLEQKLNTFINSITPTQTQPLKQPKPIPKNDILISHPPSDNKLDKKKLSLANINSKLNNMLSAKKINISTAISVQVQKQKQSERKIQVEYDPQFPNSYQLSKNNYLTLFTAQTEPDSDEDQTEQYIAAQAEHIQEDAQYPLQQPEEKEQIALRMMQKFGYKVGEGLGKQSQGIRTPLIVRKTTDSSGIIQPSNIPLNYLISPEVSTRNALAAYNIEPTEVIVLVGLLNMSELQEGLEEEIKQECCLHGVVKDWILYLFGELRIFVQFQTKEQALNAFARMNSKYFGEKLVSVRFYHAQHFIDRKYNDDLHPHIST